MAYFRILQKYKRGHMVVVPAAICHALDWRGGDTLFIHLVSARTIAMEKVVDLDVKIREHSRNIDHDASE